MVAAACTIMKEMSRSKLSHAEQQLGCKCPKKQWNALYISFMLVCCLDPSSNVRLLSRPGGQCTLAVTLDNASDMHNNDVTRLLQQQQQLQQMQAALRRRYCACRMRCPTSQRACTAHQALRSLCCSCRSCWSTWAWCTARCSCTCSPTTRTTRQTGRTGGQCVDLLDGQRWSEAVGGCHLCCHLRCAAARQPPTALGHGTTSCR